MNLTTEQRQSIRQGLINAGFNRTGYSSPAGEGVLTDVYTETWTLGENSVVITWGPKAATEVATVEPLSHRTEIFAQARQFGWQAYNRLGKAPGVEFKIKDPHNGRETLSYVEVNFDADHNVIELVASHDGHFHNFVMGEGVTSTTLRDIALQMLSRRA